MTIKTRDSQRVAGRYATALLSLALEAGLVERVEADLTQLETLIRDSREFRALLADQVETRDTHVKALAAISAKAGFQPLTGQFLGLLATKRRLSALKEIIAQFRALNAKRQGIVEAEIYTARKMPDPIKDKLAKALEAQVNGKIRIAEHIEPQVLGGLQIRIGSWMVDDTVTGKLQRLEQTLKRARQAA